jgi:hypothetical protein
VISAEGKPVSRVLFVVWCSPTNRFMYPIARLLVQAVPPRYEFAYVQGLSDAEEHGYPSFPIAERVDRVERFDDLPPLFTTRLMPRSRPDYRSYIERLGLEGNPEPTVILARSEGRKVTDNLEICAAPEFDAMAHSWVYYGFVRAVRHVEGAEQAIASLVPREDLLIERDVASQLDVRGLLLRRSDRARVGFVPHALTEDLRNLMDRRSRVEVTVARINPPPAPVHQRLLVAFRAEHKDGFQPLSGPRYKPIAADATTITFEPKLRAR